MYSTNSKFDSGLSVNTNDLNNTPQTIYPTDNLPNQNNLSSNIYDSEQTPGQMIMSSLESDDNSQNLEPKLGESTGFTPEVTPISNSTQLESTKILPQSLQTSEPPLLNESQDSVLPVRQLQQSTVKEPTVQTSAIQPSTFQSSNVDPLTVQQQIVQPQNVQPQTVQPQTVQPQTEQPQTVQQQTVQPQTVKPQTVPPQTNQSQSIQSQIVQPKSVQPPILQQQSVQSQIVQSKTEPSQSNKSLEVGLSQEIKTKPLLQKQSPVIDNLKKSISGIDNSPNRISINKPIQNPNFANI